MEGRPLRALPEVGPACHFLPPVCSARAPAARRPPARPLPAAACPRAPCLCRKYECRLLSGPAVETRRAARGAACSRTATALGGARRGRFALAGARRKRRRGPGQRPAHGVYEGQGACSVGAQRAGHDPLQISAALETTDVSVQDNGGDGRHVRRGALRGGAMPPLTLSPASTSSPPPSRASLRSTASAWCTRLSGQSCRHAAAAAQPVALTESGAGGSARGRLDEHQDARGGWRKVSMGVLSEYEWALGHEGLGGTGWVMRHEGKVDCGGWTRVPREAAA